MRASRRTRIRKRIRALREWNKVPLLREVFSIVRVDILKIRIVIFLIRILAGEVRLDLRAELRLTMRPFTEHISVVNVRQRTLGLGAVALVSVVRTFNNMALPARFTQGTIAQGGERPADWGRRRNVDVRIAAYTFVDAVAALEVRARRDAVIGEFVREVATIAGVAGSFLQVCFANGDLGRVVSKQASGSIRTSTWTRG